MTGRRGLAAAIAVIVVIGGCTPSTTDGGSPPAPSTEGSELGSDPSATTGAPAASFDVGELPLTSMLEADPPVVEPGDPLAVSSRSALSGTLEMALGDGSVVQAPFAFGKGSLEVPLHVAPGFYPLEVTSDDGSLGLGFVQVVTGPTITLSSPRTFVRPGAPGLLSVTAHGVAADMRALILVEDPGEAFFATFVPGPGRTLMPSGFEGVPLAEFLDTTWKLPDFLAGRARLVMVDGGTVEGSNSVHLHRCDTGGTVTGTLEGPGTVEVVWLDGEVRTATLVSDEGGPFRLEAGPGLVSVAVLAEGGEEEEPIIIERFLEVPCGGSAAVGHGEIEAGTQVTADDLAPGVARVSSSGSLSAEFEDGAVICDASGDELSVFLADDLDDRTMSVSLEMYDRPAPGRHEVDISLLDEDFDFSSGFATLELSEVGDTLAGMFNGQVEGDAGFGVIRGAFKCAPVTSRSGGSFVAGAKWWAASPFLPTTLLQTKGVGSPGGDTPTSTPTCRSALITSKLVSVTGDTSSVGEAEMRAQSALMEALPKVNVATQSGIARMLGLEATEILLGATPDQVGRSWMESSTRAARADFAVFLVFTQSKGVIPLTRSYTLSMEAIGLDTGVVASVGPIDGSLRSLKKLPQLEKIIDALRTAGICGETTPTHSSLEAGQTVELTHRVVRMDGQEVSGAEVRVTDHTDGVISPDCGELSRSEGTTQSPFLTEFTAASDPPAECSEYPRFAATWNSPHGEISTDPVREESDATVDVERYFDFTIVAELSTELGPVVYSSQGRFTVLEDGFIVGEASGTMTGKRRCTETANGVVVFQEDPPTDMSATFELQVHGRAGGGERETELRLLFLGFGWSLEWAPVPEVCTLLLLDETAEGILRVLAYQPDTLAGEDGIIIQPVLGEKWIFINPEGLGTVSVTLEERT